jgi:hypothetical protein
MHYNQGHVIEFLYFLIPVLGIGLWIYSLLWQHLYYPKKPRKAKWERQAFD